VRVKVALPLDSSGGRVFSLELEEPFNIRGVLASPISKEDE